MQFLTLSVRLFFEIYMVLCPVQFITRYFEIMMSAQQFDSWKQVLEFDRSNASVNERMSDVISMSKPGLSSPECIDFLRQNPGSALLAIDYFQELVLVHNVTVIGPNFRVPDMKILALSGSMVPSQTAFVSPRQFLTRICPLRAPVGPKSNVPHPPLKSKL